jgi:RHS repeat-associated protein
MTTLVGQTTMGYDGLGITNSITHQNGSGGTLESFAYTIDIGGRLTSETDNINGTQTSFNIGYDQANQMTSAGANTYGYTLNGNRNNNGLVPGPGNQLQSDGNWNFTYDPQGNVTKKTGIGANAGLIWVLAYNAANQLVSATETNNGSPVVAETNQYDVFGNWIEQDISLNGGPATVTRFAHQVVNNDASDGGQDPTWADLNSTNAITTRRLWALDQVFARLGASTDWYLPDRLGSIRGLMNNGGTLDDTINFDAIGNKTSESTPANGDRYGYAGGQFDSNLLVILFGGEDGRFYSPADQMWLSQDAVGLGAGPNPYMYGDNAPVNETDPSGLAGRPVRPPVGAPRQFHHAIPWNNGTLNHQNSRLVQAAGVELRTYGPNQQIVINHLGRHTNAYHREVGRRLTVAWEALVAQGLEGNALQQAARQSLDGVIAGIWRDIGNGSLRLYRTKFVWLLPRSGALRFLGGALPAINVLSLVYDALNVYLDTFMGRAPFFRLNGSLVQYMMTGWDYLRDEERNRIISIMDNWLPPLMPDPRELGNRQVNEITRILWLASPASGSGRRPRTGGVPFPGMNPPVVYAGNLLSGTDYFPAALWNTLTTPQRMLILSQWEELEVAERGSVIAALQNGYGVGDLISGWNDLLNGQFRSPYSIPPNEVRVRVPPNEGAWLVGGVASIRFWGWR